MRALRQVGQKTAATAGALLLVLGAAFIAASSLVYFSDELPPFLLEKLPLPHEDLWLAAVRVHVVATLFALPACVLLASAWLRRRAAWLHRWLGRATALVLVGVAVPTGSYLAFFARGGWPSTLGFLVSAAIVLVATVQATLTARRRDLVAHRRASLHVLAQLSVAVSSRLLLILVGNTSVDPTRAYIAALWLPVVLSAGLVELVCRPRHPQRNATPQHGRNHAPSAVHAVPHRLPLELGTA